jgi:geranylgeranyl pyrophosphate synthase
MKKILKEKLEKIEQYIFNILPPETTETWLNTVLDNATLKQLSRDSLSFNNLKDALNKLCKPGYKLLKRGGKRWRPLLMLLSCELVGGSEEQVLPFTPIVEIVHNGTLIIDDIEDNSDYRRGEKAIHREFGLDMAINTGNFMYFLPVIIIFNSNFDDKKKLSILKYYIEDMNKLHIGQGLDILWHKYPEMIPDKGEYFTMCRYKTGSLARMSARIGAEIGDGTRERIDLLGSTAETLGLIFQILDDVKNLTTGNPGKQRGDDILEGKKSFPVILLYKENREDFNKLISIFQSIREAEPVNRERLINKAISLLETSGCIEEAKQTALKLLDDVISTILKSFQPLEARQNYIDLLKALVNTP